MVPWVMTAKKEKVPKKKKQQPRKKGDGVIQGGAEAEEETDAKKEEQVETQEAKPEGDKTFLRYYHLYRKGELESDIEQAGGNVIESGYEKDNWWAIASLK
jgi:tRNA (uracil-5-)-methyltransferase TRM9